MDARLTDEQHHMQDTVADFLEARGGIAPARHVLDGDVAVVQDLWDDLADLDLTALTVPLDRGGLGEGMVYLAAILEALGRYASPVPFAETMAFCGPLVAAVGTEHQRALLEDIAAGDRMLSFGLYDVTGEEIPAAITFDATPEDAGFRLDGTKTLVPYARAVDDIVIAARTGDAPGFQGLSLFRVDPGAASIRPLDSLDRTRPLYELSFEDVHVDETALVGEYNEGGGALENAIDRFTVALCARLVGAADRAVEMSVEHGTERTQYGHPIGRFQAVKHRIADMWMAKEHARSLTYRAAWAIDEAAPAPRAASMAKAYVGRHLPDVFASDIFNHGGMGFTWEHDGHIYLKQVKAWQNYLGSPEYHLDRVATERAYETDVLPGYPAPTALTDGS